MFALRRRAIGVSVALVAAASLTASLLISTALAQNPDPSITSVVVSDIAANSATVTVNLPITTLTGPRSTSSTVPKRHTLVLQSPDPPPTTLAGIGMAKYFLTRPLCRRRLTPASRYLNCRLPHCRSLKVVRGRCGQPLTSKWRLHWTYRLVPVSSRKPSGPSTLISEAIGAAHPRHHWRFVVVSPALAVRPLLFTIGTARNPRQPGLQGQ